MDKPDNESEADLAEAEKELENENDSEKELEFDTEDPCKPGEKLVCTGCGGSSKTCKADSTWSDCVFETEYIEVFNDINFGGGHATINYRSTCNFLGDNNYPGIDQDTISSIKVYANIGTCIVLRDDGCGETIELQCGFRGTGCVQSFANFTTFTPGYSSENVSCSTECDDAPNLSDTVGSFLWSHGACVFEN